MLLITDEAWAEVSAAELFSTTGALGRTADGEYSKDDVGLFNAFESEYRYGLLSQLWVC